MYYYGDRSCDCHPLEDIGVKYFSSSTNRFFQIDQRHNPQDYKYKIIKIFETCRRDATLLEIKLHNKFDVKNHDKFINKANQTSNGFKSSGRDAADTRKNTIDKDTGLSLQQLQNIKQSEKKKGIPNIKNKGSNSGRAKIIKVYDNNNLVFESNGNLSEMCKKYNILDSHLRKSFKNNAEEIKYSFSKRNRYLIVNGWRAERISDLKG